MSIFNHFKQLTLSADQESTLTKLEVFLNGPAQVFILKGYAGSGKTTILKGLTEYLSSIKKPFALMAPTGRAAKVIRERTGKEAFTIHKSIYSYDDLVEVEEGESFFYSFNIASNTEAYQKVYIVDEASMLSDSKSEGEFFRFGSGYLLTDLINYTRVTSETIKSKIIFVGDPCQLPPVTDKSSKAFEKDYLSKKFNVSVDESEMKEVKRQSGQSGILKVAAKIRKSISSGFFNDFKIGENGIDIFNPIYENFINTWEKAESPKIIIAYKNKTCLDLNLQIRERKFGANDLPMQKGDIVIMGGNDYKKGIFNGEFAVVNEVDPIIESRTILLKGKPPVILSWRSIELVFPDSEIGSKIVKGRMLENFLNGENVLRPEEFQALYVDFITRHPNLKPKTKEFKEAILNDVYFNSLLLKYGYAITCHKAQGGEWDNVFTVWDHENDKTFNCYTDNQLKRAKDNVSYYRWAYTAITRASKTLFALNPPSFNSYSSMTFVDEVVIDSLNQLTGQQLQSEEIEIDSEMIAHLEKFKLLEKSIPIQDHFIKVRHTVSKQYIDIIGMEMRGFEVLYIFKREDKTAGVKTWFKGDGVFNGKFQKHPSQTNNGEFYIEVEALLNKLSNVAIKRNTTETIIGKIEFEFELEEKFPFTHSLFDDLGLLFSNTSISIVELEHMQYKERYTFRRFQEKATVDFEYGDNGFFGRVLPILSKTDSKDLLSNIQISLKKLKGE
jgi:hypothetical protein